MPANPRAREAGEADRLRFAAALRKHTTARGWTQTDLAKQSGVGRDLVNAYFHGRHWPNGKQVSKLAMALGVEVEALIGHAAGVSSAPGTGTAVAGTAAVHMTAAGDGMAHLRIDVQLPLRAALRVMEAVEEGLASQANANPDAGARKAG